MSLFLHGTVFKLTTNKRSIDTFAKKQFEMHPVFKPQMKRGGGGGGGVPHSGKTLLTKKK